jgi:stage II sporulation protein R
MLVLCALVGQVPKVVRLHVLANSNDEGDQRIKLEVRDAVIAYLEDHRGEMDGFEGTKAYIEKHLDTLQTVANGVLDRYGIPYGCSVSVCVAPFPEKTYGDVVFPAGDYHALRIVLGCGKGNNWWCVLFPPLCLLEGEQTQPAWQPQDGVTYKSWLATLFQ